MIVSRLSTSSWKTFWHSKDDSWSLGFDYLSALALLQFLYFLQPSWTASAPWNSFSLFIAFSSVLYWRLVEWDPSAVLSNILKRIEGNIGHRPSPTRASHFTRIFDFQRVAKPFPIFQASLHPHLTLATHMNVHLFDFARCWWFDFFSYLGPHPRLLCLKTIFMIWGDICFF